MDSDEVMDMFCESCFKDGIQNVPAVVFCVDCVSFFCKTCLKFHIKFLPDHIQQSHNDMPKDFCQENCKIHQTEIAKYYCKRCDCFACSKCKNNDHKTCESVHYVPTLLNEFEEKREYKNFQDMLQAVEQKLQETKSAIEHGYNQAEQRKEETKLVIKEYKENTDKMFDDLEREVDSEIGKINSEDKKNLAEISTKISGLESSFEVIKSENESKKLTDQRCKIFRMVKSCCSEVKSIKDSLEDLNNGTGIHEVSYEPANIIKTTADFGKLKIIKPGKNRNSGHKSEERKQAKGNQTEHSTSLWVICLVAVIIPVIAAVLYRDIYYSRSMLENVFNAAESTENLPKLGNGFNAEESTENNRGEQLIIAEADLNRNMIYTLRLSKLWHLHKNYLIALDDNKYHLLLLISTIEKKIVSDFLHECKPQDITKVGENQVAVICLWASDIHIIQIDNMHTSGAISWSVVKTIKTQLSVSPFYKISYRNEFFFISSKKEISVFDMNGNDLKTIFFNKGDDLYIQSYLTVRKNTETLHIFSVYSENSLKIIHVTNNEEAKTSFSHEDLHRPKGMAADDNGNVYVCGFFSNTIYVLSGDLTKGEVLLNETDGIQNPLSIAYSSEDKKLFILSYMTNVISVFKIV